MDWRACGGAALGLSGIGWIVTVAEFVTAVFTCLFQFVAVPTIALAIITTLADIGAKRSTGRIFLRTIVYTLLTTTFAAIVGLGLYIIVTSLFVMQNAGVALTLPMMLLGLVIAVVSAVGNAGVPMGCYFLTLSLTAEIGGAAAIMGVILPVFTVIDMVETSENVWSDSCVCALVDRDLRT